MKDWTEDLIDPKETKASVTKRGRGMVLAYMGSVYLIGCLLYLVIGDQPTISEAFSYFPEFLIGTAIMLLWNEWT